MKQCALDRIVGISSAIAAAFSFSAENILLARFSCQPHRYFTITVSAFALTLCVSILTLCRRPTFNLGLRTLPVLAFGFTAAIGHTLFVLAVFNLGPGDGNLIFYTEPIFVIIFSAIFLQNAFRWTDPLFAGFAIAAVFVLSTNIFNRRQEEEKGDTELIIPQSIFGVICGLFSALASAASIVIARKLSENEIDYSIMITSYAIQYLIVSLLPTTLSKSWGILGNTRDVLVMVLTGISLSGGLAFEFFAVTKENPSVVTTILLSDVIITYFGEYLLYFVVDFHAPTSILPVMHNYFKREIDIIRPSIIRQETEAMPTSKPCEGVFEDIYQPKQRKLLHTVQNQLKDIKL
ncbi:solute carrier family 35 member G1-like [Apostichopus japonicus]|uniref:solute carrier family 35 member G1-like n=1 Tax=Stichopus japonicus TaxID=307972 RepID=UPI003AB2553A